MEWIANEKRRETILSQVEVWRMTEEERLAYIEKHPIKPSRKRKSDPTAKKDWKWRGVNNKESVATEG